jgi:hypothetical protein
MMENTRQWVKIKRNIFTGVLQAIIINISDINSKVIASTYQVENEFSRNLL